MTIQKITYHGISKEYEIMLKDKRNGKISYERWTAPLPLRFRIWIWRHDRSRKTGMFDAEWTA